MALYAFDGTWNKEHDAGEYGRNTNVVRFKDLQLELLAEVPHGPG